jgi:hypothetical protein
MVGIEARAPRALKWRPAMPELQIRNLRTGAWITIAEAPTPERLAGTVLSGVALVLFVAVLLGWCAILGQP